MADFWDAKYLTRSQNFYWFCFSLKYGIKTLILHLRNFLCRRKFFHRKARKVVKKILRCKIEVLILGLGHFLAFDQCTGVDLKKSLKCPLNCQRISKFRIPNNKILHFHPRLCVLKIWCSIVWLAFIRIMIIHWLPLSISPLIPTSYTNYLFTLRLKTNTKYVVKSDEEHEVIEHPKYESKGTAQWPVNAVIGKNEKGEKCDKRPVNELKHFSSRKSLFLSCQKQWKT